MSKHIHRWDPVLVAWHVCGCGLEKRLIFDENGLYVVRFANYSHLWRKIFALVGREEPIINSFPQKRYGKIQN